MNITLDKEEDLKDRLFRYAQIVNGKRLQEFIDMGWTTEQCMDNMVAIEVKMPETEGRIIYTF